MPDRTTTAPRERPIIFSAESVRALLAGTKTQTRRIAEPLRARVRRPIIPDFPLCILPDSRGTHAERREANRARLAAQLEASRRGGAA